MTEKEKMLNGYLYDPFSEDMPEERRRCHELCQQYNLVPESNYQKREELLKQILPILNEGVYLQGPIQFDFGKNLYIGKNSYANFNFVVLDEGKIEIGDNVWIGGGVTVLPGVTIGNNVVIGAGSIVTKDIPDNSLAYGNPCRVHKTLPKNGEAVVMI